MKYLFNSKGSHIANFLNGQLYSPSGKNIGHYMEREKFFIDMSGKYLGELIMTDRLMYNLHSPYRSINFGNYGNYGNIGHYGNPGNHGYIGFISGYEDVKLS